MSSPPDPLPLEPPWVQGGGVHAKRIQAPFLIPKGYRLDQWPSFSHPLKSLPLTPGGDQRSALVVEKSSIFLSLAVPGPSLGSKGSA